MKKIVLILTLVCLALFLFSCAASCQHVDDNLDGTCDECEHEIDKNQGDSTHTHTPIHVDASEAQCYQDGSIEHWLCVACGKFFADRDGKNELTSITIPAAHTGGTEKRNERAATAHANGYTGDTWCLGCETKLAEGEDIPCLDHIHDLVITHYVAETCESDGNIEYFTCTICDKIYSNEGGSDEITMEQTILPGGHKYDSEWTTTVVAHWHNSQCPHEDKDYGVHEFVDGICVECGFHQVLATPTLTYKLNPDNQSYTVTGTTDKEIKELVIPATYQGLPVTEIAVNAFYDCYILEVISFAEAHNLTVIGGYTFASPFIKTIYFGNDSSIQTIGQYAFYKCSGFEEIIIRNSSLKTIETAAFGGCGGLTKVIIESTELTTIDSHAFSDCINLRSIDLSSSKIEFIGNTAFSRCYNLTEINFLTTSLQCVEESAFDDSNELLYTEYENGIYVKIGNNSHAILIGTSDNKFTHFGIHENTKNIAYGAFKNCTSLTTIYAPEGLIGISDFAFYGCSGLLSFSVPDTTLYIGHCAFEKCSNLGYVQITKESQLEFIGDAAFYECKKLSSIVIPTSVTTINAQCFAHSGLVTVYYCGTESDWDKIVFGGNNIEIEEYSIIL